MGRTDRFRALRPQQKRWLPYLLLTLAVFAVYANVYQNIFVWDDLNLIVYNGSLQHWSSFPDLLTKTTNASFYRPLQVVLYFFIYQLFGLSAAAFHEVNVLLQAVTACLVYRLGCRIGFYARASFAGALLWGIHPLWSICVAYASGTADLLAGLFCLTGLLVLLPDFAPRKMWLAAPLFLLALLSKESAIVFPALATVTLFLVSKEGPRPVTYVRTWPLWVLAAAYLIGWLMCPALNNVASYGDITPLRAAFYEHNVINRILTSLATLPVYLGLIVWPADLRIGWWGFPVFTTVADWQVVAGAAIVVTALLLVVRSRGKRSLPLVWGMLWFGAALSPNTGILKPINMLFAENWIYLPAIGLFLGLSQTAAVWIETLRSKRAPMIAAGVVVLAALALGTRTYIRSTVFHDELPFFENVLKDKPESGWVHFSLGQFYLDHGEFDRAAKLFQFEIDHPHNLPKVLLADVHWKIAMAMLHLRPDKEGETFTLQPGALQACRQLPEVIAELGKVLQNNPDYYYAHQVLAFIYRYQGNNQMADFHEREVKAIMQRQEKTGP